jgi:DNA repair protein RadC
MPMSRAVVSTNMSASEALTRTALTKTALVARTLPIKAWPKSERPREKLIDRGAHALSDAELLAVLLRSGTRGRNAIELAQAHIVAFGSLRELLTAGWKSWADKDGVGVARYAALQAALELARRHLLESLKLASPLTTPDTTRRFLLAQLRDRPYEVFCVLYLDSHHRLIAFEELFRGTTDSAQVHTKEVLRQTLTHNASALILAHNHPSGVMEPSQADEYITRRLRDALALLDVRVLDHLIVGDGSCYSFAEHGLL